MEGGKTLVEVAREFKVKELLPADFELVRIDSNANVVEALKILKEKNIHSAPIFDEAKKEYLGLIDMVDLTTTVAIFSESHGIAEALAGRGIGWDEWIQHEKEVVNDIKVTEVAGFGERSPWSPVYCDFPLHSLLDMFSKQVNLHRVPVVTGDGAVVGLISQWRVIQFLHEQVLPALPRLADKKVGDCIDKECGNHKVFSINQNELVLEAWKSILENNILGLAVVDDHGVLVGSISVSDIKRSSSADSMWADVRLPIAEFLRKDFFSAPRNLVTCTKEDTLSTVFQRLVANHVHRIFVVDGTGKAQNVLSLCDVISALQQE
ncbi:hypothetical protein QOT17_016364 [Balamuthia mandrillaris]